MKSLRKLSLFLLAIVATLVFVWQLYRPTDPVEDTAKVAATKEAEFASISTGALETVVGESRSAEEFTITEDVHEAIAGTYQMYTAHEPIRLPEVADPNSESNRRILETMVHKARARMSVEPTEPSASR